MRIRVPWVALERRLAAGRSCIGCAERPPTTTWTVELSEGAASHALAVALQEPEAATVQRRSLPCCATCRRRAWLGPAAWAAGWFVLLAVGVACFAALQPDPDGTRLEGADARLVRFVALACVTGFAAVAPLGWFVLRFVCAPAVVRGYGGRWEDPTWLDISLGNAPLAAAARADRAPRGPGDDPEVQAELARLRGAAPDEVAAQLRRRFGLTPEQARALAELGRRDDASSLGGPVL